MKRCLDVVLGVAAGAVLFAPMLLIALAVKLTSRGPAVHWSKRIGANNKPFMMPKFRTMELEAPLVATHLLEQPDRYLTPIGGALRKASLDELPQIYSIIKGDLSFVGPRPALFNQTDLIELRTRKAVHSLVPGLTGWAQINGRDDLPIPVKVEYDEQYLKNRSLLLDLKILVLTVFRVVRADGVRH